MMRLASAGPIPGSASISAAFARSRSTIVGADPGSLASVVLRRFPRGERSPRLDRLAARTESTRWICLSSAFPCADVGGGALDRVMRTALPDSATIARNQSAFRSLGVGTPNLATIDSREPHQSIPRRVSV
jgi:hypothetical protein